MSRLPQVPTDLERNIQFFRVVRDDLSPWPGRWANAIGALHRLPLAQRQIEVDEGTVTRIAVRKTDDPFHVVMTTVRKAGLPTIEHDSGRRRFLELEPDAGLGERTHVVVTEGVVIVEHNQLGPRAAAFLRFLQQASGTGGSPMVNVRLGRLIRGDVFAHLGERGGEVTVLDLRVPTDLIRRVTEADESLGASLEAASAVGTAETVELVLRKSLSKDDPTGLTLPPNLLMRLFDKLNPFRARCKVRATVKTVGESQAVIDLLSDPVQVRMPFPLVDSRNRSVAEAVAFAALTQAYHDLRDEVRSARPI